jgi:hypothetical protein
VLPIAVVRQSLSATLWAIGRTQLSWLRSRAIPLAAAAAWLCGLVAGARCTSRAETLHAAHAVITPVRRAVTLGPVDYCLDRGPDTCEPDNVLAGAESAHRRVSRQPCTYRPQFCHWVRARGAYGDARAISLVTRMRILVASIR